MTDPLFRALQRKELDSLLDWAAAEGWNPGIGDAEAFWTADPEAFLGVEMNGELVGGGAVVSYGGEAGFMGLFLMRPEWRGRGIGKKFWYHRRDLLLSRLREGASISMDGVFAMQPFYARGGFVFTHRNLRMEGVGRESLRRADLVDLAAIPFEQVEACDRRHFPAYRSAFLRRWIRPEGGLALGALHFGRMEGLGVIRPCRRGYKVGPLYADSAEMAENLFAALSAHAVGKPIYLDVPENNPAALALAAKHGMKEVFGCARMVYGKIPALPWGSIYGVTSFELG